MSKKKAGIDLGLNEEEKNFLRDLAWQVIKHKARGEKIPEFSPPTKKLKEPRGAFVSVHKHGRLRGCIGYIYAEKPLYQTIREMAEAAAFHDPRFNPVSETELQELEIEISVLTPLQRIKDISEIEIGKHGLYIVKGPYSGLLLPQVAVEYGWDRETFLENTCIKAGLPPDSWKEEDTDIYIFSADIF